MYNRHDKPSPRRPRSPWHIGSSQPFRKNYDASFRAREDEPAARRLQPPSKRVSFPRVPPLPADHLRGPDYASSDRLHQLPIVSQSLPAEPSSRMRSSNGNIATRGNPADKFHERQFPKRGFHTDRYLYHENEHAQQDGGPMVDRLHEPAYELLNYHDRRLVNQERYMRYTRKNDFRESSDPWTFPRGQISPGDFAPAYAHRGRPVLDLRPLSHNYLLNGSGLGSKSIGGYPPADPLLGSKEPWETGLNKRHNSLPSLDDRRDPGLYQLYGLWREKTGLWNNAPYQDTLSLGFLSDSRHAASFIERFVHSCIEGLLVEVAAEVLVGSEELQNILEKTSLPVISAAKEVLQECLNEELVGLAREVRDTAVVSFWRDAANDPTVLHLAGDELLQEMVALELRSVASEAVRELVEDYLIESDAVDVFSGMYEEVAVDLLFGVVREALLELSTESVIVNLIDSEIQSTVKSFIADTVIDQPSPYSELHMGQAEAGRSARQERDPLPKNGELQDDEEAELKELSDSPAMTPDGYP